MPRVSKTPPPNAQAQAHAQARMANARMMASSSVVDRPSHIAIIIRRARRFLRPVLGAGAVVVVIFVGSLALRDAGSSDTTSGLRRALGDVGAAMGLSVRSIVIDGRENTPEPVLRRALGIMIGEPILGFSVAAARARLLSLGWVEDAVVERRLPGTLVVSLIERAPFAVWQDRGRFRLIDRNGEIMGEQDVGRAAEELSLPLVVGPGAPEAATELFDEMKPYPDIRKRLVGAVRVGQERWNLVLKAGGTVLLPGEDQDAALERLQQLQGRMQLLDRPVQIIDLRLADRVVVRPRALPPVPAGTDDLAGVGKSTGDGAAATKSQE
ncbi:cell division protein FtsQ/DivIB [Acidisoma sp.]|uniref:cell division protein FtsQ/DivIB n=1 Tax=Acidisoma sp. TaxID=1872115 RepID=UPI003B002150